MNVTINDQNLVELVDTWFPNPVYGDMDYEMRYTRYKDFGGVMFPQLVHVHQGDPRLNPAHNLWIVLPPILLTLALASGQELLFGLRA